MAVPVLDRGYVFLPLRIDVIWKDQYKTWLLGGSTIFFAVFAFLWLVSLD